MVYTEDVLRTASGKRVLVIGDVMLDQYIYGQIERLSPETGVPVILEKSREQMLGGAANVAVNIAALGGHCHLIGLTGNDAAASIMSTLLTSWPGIDADLVKEPSRQTTTKTRFLNKRTEAHLFRLDQECTDTPPREVCEDIAERALKALHRTNVVVLSDYCKGVLTSDLIMRVIDAATSLQIPVVVDPKRKDFQLYSGATVIAPNLNELSSAIGRALPQDDIEIGQAASSLISDLSVTSMCVKRSEAGLQLVCASGSTAKFAATSRNVIDVAGAGDTVVACLALSMACGTDLETAVFLSNAAAGIAVAKEGVASVSYDELMATLKYPKSDSKIFWAHNISPLLQHILRWKADGRKVGFTNGCFDLLHAGHISSFDEAREQVDHLVVAINSDHSVKRLKGPMRPIQDENTRAIVVAALQAVDAVIIFEEDTPLEIIAQLQPCTIFKGGDYKAEDVVGHDLVSSYGGRVVITDHRSGISTTETIRRAQETRCGPLSSITHPRTHGSTLFEYNATTSAALSLQSAHKVRKEISELYTWLKDTVWPYWQEYGLARKTDGVPFGFNEYLGGSEGAMLSDQQRLLVVARQTYVFSEALAAGISKAEEPVLLGLRLMRSHARNEESGFYDSFFFLHGSTQNLDDEPKSLYDHAFVLLALASAMKVLPSEEIREDALSLDQCIQTNFHGTRMGFHDTLPPTESRRQNPLMHLLEAYLAAFEAFRSDVYLSRADDLMNLFLKHLWDPMTGAVPEQLDDCMHAELVEGRYVVEPGHLAEWVRLVHWYKNINVSLGRPLGWKEDLTIKGMIKFYETHGRHSTTRALVDEVWSDGEHCRESQRLWPQTERLQAELLRQDMSESGISEAMNVLKDYIDAGQSGLWAEFRSSCGSFDPGSCKASSMYHLTCAITTAWKVFQPLEDSGKSPERTADYAKLSNTVTVRPNDEPHCEVSPRTRYDSPILTPTRDADEAATDDETKSVNTGVEDFVKPMVVVTGGAGFIGSNVVAALNESNKYDVVVSDYLGSDDKWLNLRKRTIRDLIPPGELMAWLKDRNDIQAIIHMGANSSTQARDGDEVMESNFRTSLRLLDWCTERQVKFIYASSAATYGNGDQGFDDDMSLDYLKTLRPLNLYGWSKHLFDKEVAQRRESGMALPPVCIGLKFFNVYGPNEYHKSAMASLVTKYFPSIQAGKSVDLFRSYRDEYADGGQLRDFVYVHDVTDAVLWLLDHASPGVAMYNIGSARASSFVELVTASFTAMGLPPQINFVDMPAALRSSYQYYTKAEDVRLREIGYNLPWSTVQEAVTHFVETYLATEDAYR